ncbi:MAG: hypothetical protein WCD49_14880 [Candidatus Acidiferrales bacterium]
MTDKSPLTRNPSLNSESASSGGVVPTTNLRGSAATEADANLPGLREGHPPSEPFAQDPGLKILLTRMDTAFSEYARESEQLSVLLSKSKSLPGWTSYHELLRQRTAEVVAHEQYRRIQDELFKRIVPPSVDEKPDTKFNWLIAKTR